MQGESLGLPVGAGAVGVGVGAREEEGGMLTATVTTVRTRSALENMIVGVRLGVSLHPVLQGLYTYPRLVSIKQVAAARFQFRFNAWRSY
jgi:hypothetical protein